MKISLMPIASLLVFCLLLLLIFLMINIFHELVVLYIRYVTIREYKEVTGKCSTCALLSQLRKKFRDDTRKRYITNLFSLHRSAYMGERKEYSNRYVKIAEVLKKIVVIIIITILKTNFVLNISSVNIYCILLSE